ncbi:MAG: hypothetical protein K2X47_04675, partial [Bdellovibrionales bacterium]|nr:hypothetical protein [Bdellovibrionales bacterium]
MVFRNTPPLLALLLVGACATSASNRGSENMNSVPLIIGHRGASGERPEHTLESYALAIDQGADFIEPDLVSTKDGVLIARHENDISNTTDVAKKFPKRKTTKTIDGQKVTGWFTEDFTLKEIETLRAKERLPQRDQSYNGKFEIPTFQEVLELVKKRNADPGRTHPIGIYPETKHPTYFKDLGLPLEPGLLKLLARYGYNQRSSPIFIQSFETSNLRELRKQTPVRLIQLLDEPELSPYDLVKAGIQKTYLDLTSSAGLEEIKSYADGVGPYKRFILPVDTSGKML